MAARDALVAEVAVEFENLGEAADEEALEKQFRGDAECELEQDAIMHEQGRQQLLDAADSPCRSGSLLAASSNEPGSGVEGREQPDRGQNNSGCDSNEQGKGGSRQGAGTWESEFPGAGDATEDAIANALRAAREAGVELDDADIM